MKKRTRITLEDAETPMSSMIDVVFLLLIYFIVVQKPIIDLTLLKADLPTSPNTQTLTNPTILRIDVVKRNIKGNDDYYKMNGKWWKSEHLFKQLNVISESDPKTTIMINCGPLAKHQKLIDLLDACSNAELENLNIVNQ